MCTCGQLCVKPIPSSSYESVSLQRGSPIFPQLCPLAQCQRKESEVLRQENPVSCGLSSEARWRNWFREISAYRNYSARKWRSQMGTSACWVIVSLELCASHTGVEPAPAAQCHPGFPAHRALCGSLPTHHPAGGVLDGHVAELQLKAKDPEVKAWALGTAPKDSERAQGPQDPSQCVFLLTICNVTLSGPTIS